MTNLSIVPAAGKYIVAVSGGVDSVVLLDLLSKDKDLDLVVAHYDHGIRTDSNKDKDFVESLAKKHKYIFEYESGDLGSSASEDYARKKRYEFLNKIKKKYDATAIITAHHQDDVIETCFINVLRGTGRRGLSSLNSQPGLYRPLISVSKSQIIKYAEHNKLKWHEDSTNSDPKYLRNYLRLNVLANITDQDKQKILKIIDDTKVINEKIDKEVNLLLRRGLHKNQNVLNRNWFSKLPHDVSKEVIHTILGRMQIKDIDKKSIEKIVVHIKTLKPGKVIESSGLKIQLTKRSARFIKS